MRGSEAVKKRNKCIVLAAVMLLGQIHLKAETLTTYTGKVVQVETKEDGSRCGTTGEKLVYEGKEYLIGFAIYSDKVVKFKKLGTVDGIPYYDFGTYVIDGAHADNLHKLQKLCENFNTTDDVTFAWEEMKNYSEEYNECDTVDKRIAGNYADYYEFGDIQRHNLICLSSNYPGESTLAPGKNTFELAYGMRKSSGVETPLFYAKLIVDYRVPEFKGEGMFKDVSAAKSYKARIPDNQGWVMEITEVVPSPKEMIEELAQKGIVQGYEDGTFRPNQFMKREDLAVALVNLFELKAEGDEKTFADVKGRKTEEAVKIAVANQLMTSQAGGTFKPSGNISMEDIFLGLVKGYELKNGKIKGYESTLLSGVDEWYISEQNRPYIQKGMKLDFYNTFKNFSVNWDVYVSRQEAAVCFYNMLSRLK